MTGSSSSPNGLNDSSNIIEADIPEIAKPDIKRLTADDCILPKIFFDLETTGLEWDTEICQISAVSESEDSSLDFDQYVLPTRSVNPQASAVNSLVFKDDKLFYKGQETPAVDLKSALTKFLVYLQSFNSPVVLIAHNCLRFDCRVLARGVILCDLVEEFSKVVVGYVDTILLFKKVLPGRRSYALVPLFADFLGQGFRAHNALDDSRALMKLWKKVLSSSFPNVTTECSVTFAFTVDTFLFKSKVLDTEETLQELTKIKSLSSNMLKKMAESGLGMDTLKHLYKCHGEDGIKVAMSSKGRDGQVRVTATVRVVKAVCGFFKRKFSTVTKRGKKAKQVS